MMRFILGLLCVALASNSSASDAKAFVTEVLDQDTMGWTKAFVQLRLTVTPKKGRTKIRALEISGATLEGRTHTLVRFTEPAELAGTAMLLREEPGGSSTQLLYQPAYDKIRPIGTSSKNERFMGTDFNYSDFERRDAEEGLYRFLPDTSCGKSTCRVVEVKAKKGLINGVYGRIEFHIHPKAMTALRTRFFAKNGTTEVKTLTVNRLKKHQGRYVVFAATMKDLQRRSKTRIDVLAIDFDKKFSVANFSEGALRGQ